MYPLISLEMTLMILSPSPRFRETRVSLFFRIAEEKPDFADAVIRREAEIFLELLFDHEAGDAFSGGRAARGTMRRVRRLDGSNARRKSSEGSVSSESERNRRRRTMRFLQTRAERHFPFQTETYYTSESKIFQSGKKRFRESFRRADRPADAPSAKKRRPRFEAEIPFRKKKRGKPGKDSRVVEREKRVRIFLRSSPRSPSRRRCG